MTRFQLIFDDGEVLEVAAEVVRRAGLAPGDPVDEALRARLVDRDLRWRVREAALRLLEVRARSRQELRGRLRRRGFPLRAVDASLDQLEAAGLVDDEDFARALVRHRLRLDPRGALRLEQELRTRGVERSLARRTVAATLGEEGATESGLALRSARAWLRRQPRPVLEALARQERSPERERARRRLQAYLRRRGFVGAEAIGAIEAAASEARDPAPGRR